MNAMQIAVFSDRSNADQSVLAKPRILYIDPDSARYRVMTTLSKCRGHRAYPPSLIACLDGDDQSERRLHNTCTTLFKHGLVEKVRGMYQLTPAGVDLVVT